MKRPLTSQETVNLLDVIYNGEKYYTGRDLTEYKKRKKRDIALFTAYLGTGCRVSELINLDIRDVCFDTSSFVVTRKAVTNRKYLCLFKWKRIVYIYAGTC